MDPRRAVGPAHDLGAAVAIIDALQRIRHGLALEAIGVRQHVADGAAGQVGIVERQHDIRQQHAFALAMMTAARGFLGHAGARGQLAWLLPDEALALPASSGATPRDFCALRSLNRAARRSTAAGMPPRCRAPRPRPRPAGACLVLHQRRLSTGPPSNTGRPGCPTMRSTIERSSRLPLAPTIIQPKPGQPATLVQRLQEPLGVGAFLDRRCRRECRPSRGSRRRCRCATGRCWSSSAPAEPDCPGQAARS